MAEVHVLKLVSGEEIVGTLTTEGGSFNVCGPDEFFIEKPIAVAYLPDENTGGVKPTLVPWAQHVLGHKIKLKTGHVMYNEFAREDLAQAYNQATGGIVTPPKGLVIPGGKR